MADAGMLTAKTAIGLADADAMLDRLCEHFAEHGTVSRQGSVGRLEGEFGSVELEAAAGILQLRVWAPNPTYLFVVKSSVAEHVVEFAAGEEPAFTWSGDGGDIVEIPYFHRAIVRGSRRVTPRMQRVTLGLDDAGRLEEGGLHIRLLIPPSGREPVWPTVATDGRVLWPTGEDELTSRVYTIRSIDRERSEVDIDIVLHEDSAGSVWARSARPGDAVGLTGPGGGDIVPAEWYLLCGDETALPAIARIAEALPESVRATLLIEVADRQEEQPIRSDAQLDLRWLHRNGAEAGTTNLLENAVRGLDWPRDLLPYALVGCERAAARALRTHLRDERGLTKERHLVAAYWRRGHGAPLHGHD